MNPLASTKCARRVVMALAAISGIFLTAGCGSSSGIGTPNGNGFSVSNFSGIYVVSLSGTDLTSTTESSFAIVGTITADGKGNIKGGTVDINDPDLGGVFTGQVVSASTYSVGQDGRGRGTIATAKGNFGIDFVLTSNSHGLITRFDNNGTASGTLDLQASVTQSSLVSLVFTLSGVDSGENPLGSVGAFTLNSSGTVTSGTQDINDSGPSVGGLVGLPLSGSSSLVLSSTTFGAADLDTSFGSLAFDVWVIDPTHLKLIETDATAVLSGDAFTQLTTFTAGQLVFTLAGSDSSGNPLVAGGFVTTTSGGGLSNGLEDYNDAGTTNTVSNFSGSCTTFVAGRCQLALTGFSNGALSNFVFAAYPSSGGIQLLEIDSLGITQGAAYAQTATSFAAGNYGLNLSGVNADVVGDVGEVDDVAQFNATTAVAPSTNMTGVLDENSILGGPISSSALSGNYAPDSPATGRGAISVTTPRTFIGGLSLEYYVVDASTVLVVQGDSNQLSAGTFEAQGSGSAVAAQSHVAMVRPLVRSHSASMRRK